VVLELPNVLVLTAGSLSFAVGLLAGVALGFAVVTRDASLLAVLDKRTGLALDKSAQAEARASLLEATWEEHLAELERKRAKARAERQRADASAEKANPTEAEEPEPPVELSPRERRRMLGRQTLSRGIG
jgi:hypothetical protein